MLRENDNLCYTGRDEFLKMPTKTRELYFHLWMLSDDNGDIGNIKKIVKKVGAKAIDVSRLEERELIFEYKNGYNVCDCKPILVDYEGMDK